MKSAITVFNDWVKSNKDDGMQKAHAPAVMDMIQFSISSLNKSFSFIDAGCGNGWVVRYMNSQILCNSALGIDGADEMIKKAKKLDRKGMYILSDLLDFIPEEKVDLVFSMEVFYYLNNPSELVNSIEKYWLKSGGRLIIGLDYYKETVFEFKTDKLGIQQDTILGGGRYSFEKETINGIGWAAGIDRLIEIISYTKNNYPLASVVFNEELKNEAIVLVNKLRNSNELNGYIEIIYKGNIEKKIKKASKLNSKFIIFVDEKQKVKISNKLNNKKPIIDIKNTDEIIKVLNVN